MAETEQAVINRIGRVRNRHCEVGGDNDAYELARWAQDATALIGMVAAWAEERTDKDATDEDRDQSDVELLSTWNRFVHDREKHGPSNG